MRSVYWGEGAERVGWGTLAFSWGAGGLLYHDGATKMKWWRLWCSVKPHGGSHASWFMVRHQAQASDYSLFGSQRGVECSLSFWGNFSAPRMYQHSVWERERESERVGRGRWAYVMRFWKVFPWISWLTWGEGVSLYSVSFLSPTFTKKCLTCLVSLGIQLTKRGHSCQLLMNMRMSANWKHLPEALKIFPEEHSRKNPQISNPWTLELEEILDATWYSLPQFGPGRTLWEHPTF